MKKIWLYIVFLIGLASSVYAQNKDYIEHVVKEKENLYRLKVKYGVSVDAIKALNPSIQGDIIKEGETLKIPIKSSQKPTTKADKPSESQKGDVATKMDPPTKLPNETIDLSKVKVKKPANSYNPLAGPEPTTPISEEVSDVIENKKKPVYTATRSLEGSLDKINPVYHVVQKGETLFSLSHQYTKSLNELKDWNNLKNTTIKANKSLIVGWDTLVAVTGATFTEIETEAIEESSKQPVVRRPKRLHPYAYTWNKQKADSTGMHKTIKETGIAVRFDDSDLSPSESNLYALHKTAPLKTIIKVTNPVNKQFVYVRVVERLPDNLVNKNTLMKLTLSAAQKINLLDDQSKVDAEYHLP